MQWFQEARKSFGNVVAKEIKSHNKKFKADKPVKPRHRLRNCYVDALTGQRNEVKMEKPKKSIFVYLIGIYLFLVQSVITAPFRQISKEYVASTGNVNYQNNQIMLLISILMIILLVQIIRYKKVFFILEVYFLF